MEKEDSIGLLVLVKDALQELPCAILSAAWEEPV
jgi:hypothetical protein